MAWKSLVSVFLDVEELFVASQACKSWKEELQIEKDRQFQKYLLCCAQEDTEEAADLVASIRVEYAARAIEELSRVYNEETLSALLYVLDAPTASNILQHLGAACASNLLAWLTAGNPCFEGAEIIAATPASIARTWLQYLWDEDEFESNRDNPSRAALLLAPMKNVDDAVELAQQIELPLEQLFHDHDHQIAEWMWRLDSAVAAKVLEAMQNEDDDWPSFDYAQAAKVVVFMERLRNPWSNAAYAPWKSKDKHYRTAARALEHMEPRAAADILHTLANFAHAAPHCEDPYVDLSDLSAKDAAQLLQKMNLSAAAKVFAQMPQESCIEIIAGIVQHIRVSVAVNLILSPYNNLAADDILAASTNKAKARRLRSELESDERWQEHQRRCQMSCTYVLVERDFF